MTHPVLPAAGSDGGRRGGMRCVACYARVGVDVMDEVVMAAVD